MTIRQSIRNHMNAGVTEFSKLAAAVNADTGASARSVRDVMTDMRRNGEPVPRGRAGRPRASDAVPVQGPAPRIRLSAAVPVAVILRDHDLPAKLREALAMLKEGKQVIPESGLRSDLHVDSNKFARAANLPEFAKYKKELRGKVYWGAPADLVAVERAMEGIYQ